MRLKAFTIGISIALAACKTGADKQTEISSNNPFAHRFFSDSSFWNQPLPANPEIDTASARWISILSKEPSGAFFGINTDKFTVPLYEADSTTPIQTVDLRPVAEPHLKVVHGYNNQWFDTHNTYGHGPNYGQVPIAKDAVMDPKEDGHYAVVDWKKGLVWDCWGMKVIDGKYYSFTGMVYEANGDGVFDELQLPIKNGESIHFYGPGRAAGVPIVAGLILYDEVKRGSIEHKLAIATRYNAYQEFVYPAIWTDGILKGGIPEGAIVQLDPALDLSVFDLTPEEKLVAQAAQRYGMVVVDEGGANAIYAQGLYESSPVNWKGKLRGWEKGKGITTIPLKHYRVLKCSDRIKRGGLNSEELDKHYFAAGSNPHNENKKSKP